LDGFLKQSDYESCVANSQLESGVLWPIPIVLDVDADYSKRLEHIDRISLLDKDGSAVAIMKLESKWRVDKQREADLVYGGSPEHPYVEMLLNGKIKDYYLGGSLLGIKLPSHYDFEEVRCTRIFPSHLH
jgi:sulfate adenylyltransferase